MAHRRKVKQLRLHFEDGPLGPDPAVPGDEGLTVLMRSVPIGTIFELGEFASIGDQFSAEGMAAMTKVFEVLSSAVIEWNLTEGRCPLHDSAECKECPEASFIDHPVPATLEGVKTLDLDEAQLLIQRWTESAAGVSAPLAQPSGGGRPSGALDLLPMEVASPAS